MQGDEGEFLRGPQDDLFRDAGDVDADHRGDERELRGEVPRGRAVDGVAGRAALEAQLGGDRLGVQAQ